MAFHGTNTRTRRSIGRASSAFGDASLSMLRATRWPALGNARSPMLRSTVRITDRPTEMASHCTVPRFAHRRCAVTPRSPGRMSNVNPVGAEPVPPVPESRPLHPCGRGTGTAGTGNAPEQVTGRGTTRGSCATLQSIAQPETRRGAEADSAPALPRRPGDSTAPRRSRERRALSTNLRALGCGGVRGPGFSPCEIGRCMSSSTRERGRRR